MLKGGISDWERVIEADIGKDVDGIMFSLLIGPPTSLSLAISEFRKLGLDEHFDAPEEEGFTVLTCLSAQFSPNLQVPRA